ncbi:MAG: O-antigen ligase family protein [Candidatus Levyibacteriota bacterium]
MKIKLLLNAQKILFYLTLLFLPTQLGKHFWPDFSQVFGIRVDYLSPTLYLTDAFIILLAISCLIKLFFSRKRHKFSIFNTPYAIRYMLCAICILALGILFSKSPLAGWYGLLKFLEFLFFGFYTAKNINTVRQWIIITTIFSIGIFFESLISITQYILGHSLNGLFYYFGERAFNSQTPNIANASINGQLILRPYGTFSHPNVLAGYLIIAMTMVIFNFQSCLSADRFSIFNLKRGFYTCSLIAGTIALFLTLSRIATLLWLLILVWLVIINFKKWLNKQLYTIRYLPYAISALIIGSVFVFPTVWQRFIGSNFIELSIVQRIDLISASLRMIQASPLFGVGLNNFLVNLPQFYTGRTTVFFLQPVHNIYLLAMAEIGIIGLGLFVWFIGKTFTRIKNQESRRENS